MLYIKLADFTDSYPDQFSASFVFCSNSRVTMMTDVFISLSLAATSKRLKDTHCEVRTGQVQFYSMEWTSCVYTNVYHSLQVYWFVSMVLLKSNYYIATNANKTLRILDDLIHITTLIVKPKMVCGSTCCSNTKLLLLPVLQLWDGEGVPYWLIQSYHAC